MTRLILVYLIPFLLPFAIYAAWVWLSRHSREDGVLVTIAKGPWFWLVIAGFLLTLSSLGLWAVLDSHKPEENYVPPRLEDGRVVPGRMVPPTPDS